MSSTRPEDGIDLEAVADQTDGNQNREAWGAYFHFIETDVAPQIPDPESRAIYLAALARTRTPKPPKFSEIQIVGPKLKFPGGPEGTDYFDTEEPETIPSRGAAGLSSSSLPSSTAALGPGELVPGPIALPATSESALGGDVFVDGASGPKGPEA